MAQTPVAAGGSNTQVAAAAGASTNKPYSATTNGISVDGKRRRRPAGTPDPDAEVVSLTAEMLLESERYVCEICNQGFQREQNLQMHRRRHKVPWKLVKREATPNDQVRKRVYVCPEPSCLHHDPCHALGDLVGIKKHFRRKHSNHKQWVCARCSKAYAVQSDYKAHLKTCGTRGHSCDCGRVFSRVESFIEHQDVCIGNGATLAKPRMPRPVDCLPQTTITNPSQFWSILNIPPLPPPPPPSDLRGCQQPPLRNYLELQLLPATSVSPPKPPAFTEQCDDDSKPPIQLHLSIGLGNPIGTPERKERDSQAVDEAEKQLRLAVAEKEAADDARRKAKRQVEIAQEEFSNAKRMRQQAQTELGRAMLARDQVVKQINAMMLQITCNACRQRLGANGSIALEDQKCEVVGDRR